MATQTKYTDVKGYATYYHYSGATTLPDVVPDFSRGRTIVFVHGAGSNGHTWHRQIEAFGAQAQSDCALTCRGMGDRRASRVCGRFSDYADFVAAFLDALKIKSAVILGHSMGGAIAMDLGLRHAARVEASDPQLHGGEVQHHARSNRGLARDHDGPRAAGI